MPMTPPKPTVAMSEPTCFMVSWRARLGTTSPPLELMYTEMSFLFSLSRYSIVATSWLPSSSSTACGQAACHVCGLLQLETPPKPRVVSVGRDSWSHQVGVQAVCAVHACISIICWGDM